MQSSDVFVAALRKWAGAFIHGSMNNFVQYTRSRGLSVTQVATLFSLQHKGCAGVSAIGEELGITSAASSQMLERMVQQGLITRTEDPNDRRLKQIVLTDHGRQVVQESIDARSGWFNQLAATMSAEEQNQVAAALDLLVEKTRLIETQPRIEY